MKTSLIFALLLAVPVFAQTSSSETAILEQAAIPGIHQLREQHTLPAKWS